MVKISRVLHAGYLLECDDRHIIFDPIFENPFSQNCYAFPEVSFDTKAIAELQIDAIFISHYHDDHFSLDSLNLLNREIPIYIFSVFDEPLLLLKKLGFKKVHSVHLFQPITTGPFEVVPLPALDADIDSIFHIKVKNELHILNVVDSWIGPRTMEILRATKWHLVLWPMQTMREIEVLAPASAPPLCKVSTELPPEWLEQIQILKPKAIVPSACQFKFEEWSWYNNAFFPITYAQFEKQILEILPETQVLRLDPGETLSLDSNAFTKAPALSWVNRLAASANDYEFRPETPPPPIADTARKLTHLTSEQKIAVRDFCKKGLTERFRKLSVPDDSYFSEPRHWRLITYDHLGLASEYQYEVLLNEIKETALTEGWIWKTEIPETKLYRALTEGESLTSIYARVTNPDLTDPLEDPLLRCLYEGIVAGYQTAQLRRLS